MVFKPSFKCFKNEKVNFIQAILRLETLLYQNIFISFYHFLYIRSDLDSNKFKKWFGSLKNMPNKVFIAFITIR